jgi:lysozyme family protein
MTMQQTYPEAMAKVLDDEGGYSNDAGDPGGPTNYGITIEDARMYWKHDATASDVRHMPRSVALDIYRKHYAAPVHYDDLPPGLDYTVFDYGINSGVSRATKVLQRFVGAGVDGRIGPETLSKVYAAQDLSGLIDKIWSERLHFLQNLGTWRLFGKGWGRRVSTGRALAHKLASEYPHWTPTVPTLAPQPASAATPEQVASGAKAYGEAA